MLEFGHFAPAVPALARTVERAAEVSEINHARDEVFVPSHPSPRPAGSGIVETVELTATIWKEDKLFVARCVELGVASQGPTRKEALANLREAVELYLEDFPADLKVVRPQIARFKVAV